MMNETKYKVGIYCRLSQEDGNDESQSIKTQKELIFNYVKKQGWTVAGIYSDDGYTGTNFNRPDFNRLINDIKLGKINLVITKDLSRLGRNYIQAGYYTEEFFPEYNVRYIAINDNYDSFDEDSCDFMPFKNIINEWYAKDISKKIRFTLDGKAKNGEPRNTVFPIYGYTYNELYERIPDPETAEIVRIIYKKYTECASTSRVAKYLQEQGVYVPRFFNAVKYGYNKAKVLAMPQETYTAWTTSMVRDIIVKDEYLGVYRTAQSKGISFKNKKRRKNDNCYIFEHRYEPLVDKETWELANSLLKRSNSGTVLVEDNIFKGLLYCKDCGKVLRIERYRTLKKEDFTYRYYCNNKECKYCNSIPKKTLEELLIKEIECFKVSLLSRRKELLECLNKEKETLTSKAVDIQTAIDKAKTNSEKIDKKIMHIVEQYIDGALPESTYHLLLESFNKEKQMFEDEIIQLMSLKCDFPTTKKHMDAMELMEKIASIEPQKLLKYDFLQKFIDKIFVKAEHIDGSKHKRNIMIDIKYNIPMELMTPVLKNE